MCLTSEAAARSAPGLQAAHFSFVVRPSVHGTKQTGQMAGEDAGQTQPATTPIQDAVLVYISFSFYSA